MRIESIELCNFLSYQQATWTPDGRLACLVGSNGAGKSSLLDGALYALFDAARGRTDDLVRLGATDMSAAIEFTYAGARYRVVRGRTTKGAGRSFLELQVANGQGWTPLTADTIRETQAAIEQLLHMDAATFGTAAMLMQGKASAFAEATAGDRKRILGQVLALDVYERAEARARGMLRDLEARTGAEREELARLDARLAERPDLEERRAARAADAEHVAATIAGLEAERTGHEARQAELAAALAAEEALEADVRRIEGTLEDLRNRYRRARDQEAAAKAGAERAAATLARANDVDAAASRLPALRAELEAAELSERAHAQLLETSAALERRLSEAFRAHDLQVAAWRSRRDSAAQHVATLEAAIAGLQPVTCPECGATFPADPAGLAASLVGAHTAAAAVGEEPGEPPAIAVLVEDRRKVQAKLRDDAHDPQPTVALRAQALEAERLAALAPELARAREAQADAERQRVDAVAELAAVDEQGQRANADLAAAKSRLAGSHVRQDLADVAALIRAVVARLSAERSVQAEAIAAVAAAEAALGELDRLAGQRAERAAAIEDAGRQGARLHRLVTAFGVGGIPARIIESVLPEFTAHAQELLDQLRPGMSLSIRAQRAKKSGAGTVEALDLVVRDDVGERPLAMFSGGERMSVSLALAVGLSRLVARRDGTAIRSLVIDEPDGLDADARRAFGQALRVLAHQGELERVVLVSHHDDLAEAGDAVYRVTKGADGSVVERVA